ncbi:MAG: NAD(P)H-nitrite reductase [Sulfurospirillaceae bacterium]|nr:NAD(P)H-nitrite reductase [Sulfurospirillaceae bacterium]
MIKWSKEERKLICYCIEVDEKTVISAIESGCNTLSKIQSKTKACTGDKCKELNPSGKCCSKDINKLIKLYALY